MGAVSDPSVHMDITKVSQSLSCREHQGVLRTATGGH